jgi:salicylate hydroxylase
VPQALRILVAGAGIGGLAAALACSRAGHAVQMFEKASKFEEIGAGIQLGPNVTRVLKGWGLGKALNAVAAFPDTLQVRDAESGKVLGQLRLGDTALQRYGAPYATVHRADLHALLLTALNPHAACQIQLGTGVDSFTQDDSGVSVELAAAAQFQRQTVQGDLLVGADGLWSSVRQHLLDDGAPQSTSHVAMRAMMAQKDLPPALRSNDITVWLGPKMHVVHYPVRGGEWLNLVFIREGMLAGAADGWNQGVNDKTLLMPSNIKNSLLQNLLHSVEHWQAWPLCLRAPTHSAPQHAQGRVALLGDAAHPMLPYLAQGAGMAIEDAAELGRCLPNEASAATGVTAALQRYAQARWQRNARVQARAIRNGKIFHASGLTRWGRDLSMKVLGERLLDLPWLYRA